MQIIVPLFRPKKESKSILLSWIRVNFAMAKNEISLYQIELLCCILLLI